MIKYWELEPSEFYPAVDRVHDEMVAQGLYPGPLSLLIGEAVKLMSKTKNDKTKSSSVKPGKPGIFPTKGK